MVPQPRGDPRDPFLSLGDASAEDTHLPPQAFFERLLGCRLLIGRGPLLDQANDLPREPLGFGLDQGEAPPALGQRFAPVGSVRLQGRDRPLKGVNLSRECPPPAIKVLPSEVF